MLRALLRVAVVVGVIGVWGAGVAQAQQILFGINNRWLVLKDEDRTEVLTLRVFGRWIDGNYTDTSNTNILNLDCSTHGAIIRFSLPTGQWGRFGMGATGDRQRATLSFIEPTPSGERMLGRRLIMTSQGTEFISGDLEPDPRSPVLQPARSNLILRFDTVNGLTEFRLEKRDAIDELVQQRLREQNVPFSEHSDAEAFAICSEHIEFVRFAQGRIDAESGRTFTMPWFSRSAEYSAVRRLLLRSGWSPIIDVNAAWCEPDDDRCRGRPEMVSCSGTGAAACAFSWRRGATKIHVFTQGEGADNKVTSARCEAGCGRR